MGGEGRSVFFRLVADGQPLHRRLVADRQPEGCRSWVVGCLAERMQQGGTARGATKRMWIFPQ